MKKKIFLIFLLIIFSSFIFFVTQQSIYAYEITRGVVFFDHRYYDDNFPSHNEINRISAYSLANVEVPYQYEVRLSWGNYNIIMSYDGWDRVPTLGYNYYGSLAFAYKPGTLDPAPWDGITYKFELKDKENPPNIYDTEYYTPPDNRFAELDLAIPNFIENHTIDWDSITPHTDGTIYYRLRIQNIAPDGMPGVGFVFDSGLLTDTIYTFQPGSIMPKEYAVRLEAIEYFPPFSSFVNRSIYFTKHELAPVPEPTTILLISSGLLGLVGVKRRLKK